MSRNKRAGLMATRTLDVNVKTAEDLVLDRSQPWSVADGLLPFRSGKQSAQLMR